MQPNERPLNQCTQTVYHQPWALPYVYVCVGAYGLDRLLRTIQTRIVTAHLHAIPELGATCIQVPGVNAGWRAGQHVRLRVLSLGMGILGWTEAHPFTIASVSKVSRVRSSIDGGWV